MNKPLHFETLAIHAAAEPDPTTGAIAPPIYLSTTFERAADGSYPKGFIYSRTDNPNRRALEALLAQLEGGAAAAAFSSGSAAAAAVFRALRPGDEALIPDDMYHGIRKLAQQLVPWGLSVRAIDMSDPQAVRAAITPQTRLLWIETPSNPLLKITDIAALSALAKDHGITVACDSTWTPPDLQPAFDYGADLIVHSSTKYLAGHSDVLGGAVITRQENPLWERIVQLQRNEGAVPSPLDCWLIQRGIKTLAYRMRGHCDNAARLAQFLQSHPKVARVYYPGLPEHPGHAVAARQMRRFGGMLSFTVVGDQAAAMRVAARTQLFKRATSLGGVESLIEHRASIEGPGSATPDNLLRLSVGLEHPDDLIDDLAQALG